ncbi:MAG: 3-isopropylmalate dehydratase small subunit [Chromatiales bacterium]|nr:3-isopropylmalate dehydratase small subunit [Chromatiales bacterium]
MEKLERIEGVVVPLDRANVDTDAIIPKQFLKSIKRSGFGPNLFDEWRYLDHGEPGMDPATRKPNAEFILNQPRYRGAAILLARDNFGCGSSREHAVWALADYGIRVVIAPSFADIFYNNCFKNGVLPLALPADDIDRLFTAVATTPGYKLDVDLRAESVRGPNGFERSFDIEQFRRDRMLEGLDEIGVTLKQRADILAYEARLRADAPWLIHS